MANGNDVSNLTIYALASYVGAFWNIESKRHIETIVVLMVDLIRDGLL